MHDLNLKDSEFQKFSAYVEEACGINLHEGKKELLKARLGKIIRQREFHSFREYYDCVIDDKTGYELKLLLDSISTNLTYFFREPDHFEFLKVRVLHELMKASIPSTNNCLRLWSAGCSSGEEAYSLAIVLMEALEGRTRRPYRLLATDLSTKVLEVARCGIYEGEKIRQIPYELKRKYFQKGENRWKGYYRVKSEVRERISFERLNFKEEFLFKELFHVIFCRNVMIYFNNPTKEALVGKFYRSLVHGGYLFVGHTESLTGVKHDFEYTQPSIYRKI